MSPNQFAYGLRYFFGEIVGGIVFAITLNVVRTTPLISWSYWIFVVLSLALTSLLILKMLRWGLIFAFGWFFGAGLFAFSGLLGAPEFVLFIVVPICLFIVRAYIKYNNSDDFFDD